MALTHEAIATLRELERGAEFGPWIVITDKTKVGDNWLIGFGYDDYGEGKGGDVYLTTHRLHASECRSHGALAEAQFAAAMRNDALALLDAAEWVLKTGYGDQLLLPLPGIEMAKRELEVLRTLPDDIALQRLLTLIERAAEAKAHA